jgi:cellobiose-specific phosphotransferase system component IIA
MNPFSLVGRACAAILIAPLFAVLAVGLFLADKAGAEAPSPAAAMSAKKINAYVGCINRLSARAYDSRKRYFSWAAPSGPTGRERIIYGTYTIYDTADCRRKVEAANTMEPHDAALEAAASAYVEAASTLEPLLKEADDYYSREDYKDDKMAKGKALHPRLVAAWDAFAIADQKLRDAVDAINDARALQKLAAIEQSEGKKTHYYVEALMIHAKRVLRAQDTDKPDLGAITQAVNAYEETVKGAEEAAGAGDGPKIGSLFLSNAKAYLVTAKQLMRRVRDHVPYSSGDKMMFNAGSGWMVEGSPPRLVRDYNQLVDAYNRGPGI